MCRLGGSLKKGPGVLPHESSGTFEYLTPQNFSTHPSTLIPQRIFFADSIPIAWLWEQRMKQLDVDVSPPARLMNLN